MIRAALLFLLLITCAAAQKVPGHLVLEQLSRMTDADRQKIIDRLPEHRRAKLLERLELYRQLPEERKQMLSEEYDSFLKLPPENQKKMRELFLAFRDLDEERRALVRQGYRQLQRLTAQQRARRLRAPAFRARFSNDEMRLLEDFVEVMPELPMRSRRE